MHAYLPQHDGVALQQLFSYLRNVCVMSVEFAECVPRLVPYRLLCEAEPKLLGLNRFHTVFAYPAQEDKRKIDSCLQSVLITSTQ